MSSKVIKIYQIYDNPSMIIRPGSRERTWMDNTRDNNAYRCLPLTIANQHGWSVHLKDQVSFIWKGGPYLEDVIVKSCNDKTCASVFGHGIITFHIQHLIKTPENYNLYISGPPNYPKEGITPLTGIYEADWAPYSFTMNWQITEPNKEIMFDQDEPICFFFPIERESIESFEVQHEMLSSNPEYLEHFNTFANSRSGFIDDKRSNKVGGEVWQKHYFQGRYPDGSKCPIHNHQTKINITDIKK